MQYIIALITLALTTFYVYRIHFSVKGRRKWIYYEVIFNCFIKFFIGYLRLPSILNYVTDIILLILIILELYSQRSSARKGIDRKNTKFLRYLLLIYFSVTIVSFVLNRYSILQYVWGFRNNFRFFIFALICCRCLKKRDIETLFDILSGYFAINILAVTYEFFFSGISVRVGDSISGLYSSGLEQSGGNGHLNWLLCVICVYAIAKYLSKEKSLRYLIYAIVGSVYMAALSELKIFFIELILIIILTIAFSKKSLKVGVLGIGGVIAVYFGINAIYRYFPQFADFYNIGRLSEYIIGSNVGYQGIGTINRMYSLSYVFNRFLNTPLKSVFGIGLGNADFSSFSFLTSSFYNANNWTLYQFFYAPFVLIETGIIGFIAFVSLFINYIIKALKQKVVSNTDSAYRVVAIVIGILSIGMIFYNQSLKIESSGYMVHALLIIPYVLYSDRTKEYRSYVRMKVKSRHG